MRRSSAALIVLALAVASAATGCSGKGSSSAFELQSESQAVVPDGRELVRLRGIVISQIATSDGYLVWTTQYEDVAGGEVRELELASGKTTTVARGDIILQGVGSTGGWAIYALRRQNGETSLIARRHDLSKTEVLTTSLISPIEARRGAVAWAEDEGDKQSVIVQNLDSGKRWFVATFPRCDGDRCYRVDGVSIAEDGVAFVRGAVGPQPSMIGRRRFTDPRPQFTDVVNDPQPDLVPTDVGPLFFTPRRGWVRWFFGDRRPRPAAVPQLAANESLLRYSNGLWFVVGVDGDPSRIFARRSDGSQRVAAAPPKRPPGTLPVVSGLAWTGRQAFAVWQLHVREGEVIGEEVLASSVGAGAPPR